MLCSDREANRIKLFPYLLKRDVHANICVHFKDDAFLPQLIDATGNLRFGDLEVGNPVHHQSAHLVVALEYSNRVSSAIQLLRGSEAGRPATDNCDAFSGTFFWRFRNDPAFGPATIYNRSFNAFDRHRLGVESQDASRFARGRTGVPGELWEIVCRM